MAAQISKRCYFFFFHSVLKSQHEFHLVYFYVPNTTSFISKLYGKEWRIMFFNGQHVAEKLLMNLAAQLYCGKVIFSLSSILWNW